MMIPSPASAAPVGSDASAVGAFSYDVDSFFGPVFTIENFVDSPGTFLDVVIQLFLAGSDVEDLTVDDVISPLTSPFQTAAFDLTNVAFDTAVLNLTFSQPGTVAVDALTGLTFDSDTFSGNTATTAIFFTPTPSQTVPEPSTLVLAASGVGLMALRRRAHPTPS